MHLSGIERDIYNPTCSYKKRKKTNELHMQLMKLENEQQHKCKKRRRVRITWGNNKEQKELMKTEASYFKR